MEVRKAQLKDVKQVLELLNATKEVRAYEGYKYHKEYVTSHLNNPMHLMLVCEEEGRILGVLCAEIWKDKKYSFVSNLVVSSTHRRKGRGRMLYSAFERYCRSKGLKVVNLLVLVTNKRMQKWCKKNGFKKGHALYFYEKNI
jgi:ribosomal protein S18 acetylase RimI-like enzyme